MNSRALDLSLACMVIAFAVAACGGDKPPASAPTARPVLTSAIQHVSPAVGISQDLVVTCNIHVATTTSAPKFEFDRSDLQPADRSVLAKVAECLTTGPLKGRSVKLIGRADPRGEPQYNMALGAQRAGGVADYLAHLGLDRRRLEITSRGDLDALGIDESSWQVDRRVDIVLAK